MIFAGLATIPERRDSLARTVASLLPQVDKLGVCLNGYPDIPECLGGSPKIVVESHQGDGMGADGKFLWLSTLRRFPKDNDTYYLSCDDDLEYPPTYAATMIEAIERHMRKAVISFHGRLVDKKKKKNYIGQTYRCLGTVDSEQRVHIAGTGVMGMHVSTLALPIPFPIMNMIDPWVAVEALIQDVPLYVLPHTSKWLKHTTHPRTIWSETIDRSGSAMDTYEARKKLIGNMSWPSL
jgi:hypothetical protein